MKYIKYAFILLIVIGLCGSFYYFKDIVKIEKKSATFIISNLQNTKEIDKFYTGVYHIPVIHMERGLLKRDIIKEGIKTYINPKKIVEKGKRFMNDEPLIQGDEGRNVVKGCCSKKYEVAVGYDHLMKILGNEPLIDAVCKGDLSKLPEPQILAINCKSTSSFGKYDSSGACYSWDSNENERAKIIQDVMADDGILEKVNERGKQSLKNLITAFCQ